MGSFNTVCKELLTANQHKTLPQDEIGSLTSSLDLATQKIQSVHGYTDSDMEASIKDRASLLEENG